MTGQLDFGNEWRMEERPDGVAFIHRPTDTEQKIKSDGTYQSDEVLTEVLRHNTDQTNPIEPRQKESYAFPELGEHPAAENPIFTAGDFNLSSGEPVETVADPFVVHDRGTFYLFMEAKESTTPEQNIHYATSTDGLDWTHQGEVLSTAGNMSYPQVFKHEGQWYMTPDDTNDLDETSVYKADQFPTDWSKVGSLSFMQYDANDTTIFKHNGLFWCLWEGGDGAGNNQLRIAYSDDFPNFDGWIEHPSSPIRDTSSVERPAGRPIASDDHVDYFIQAEVNGVYGYETRAYRINELTKTSLVEEELDNSPIAGPTHRTDSWNGIRMHHLDAVMSNSGEISFAIVDGGTGSGQWSLGVYAPVSTLPQVAKLGMSTGQTISSGSGPVSVNIDEASTDTTDSFDGTVWTCPKTGYYEVSGQLGIQWLDTGSARVTVDFMNRTTASRESRTSTAAIGGVTYQSLPLAPRTLYLEQGDTFGLNVDNTGASSMDILSGSDQTELTIKRVNGR